MNKVILIGNLTADPETRTTQSGISQTSFRLAVPRAYKDKQTGQRESDFINIVAWRQLADLCARYLSKGKKAAVEGSLQTRSYTAQDGSKRYVTEVIADSVEFLTPRADAQPAPTDPAPYPDDDDSLPFERRA